VDCGICTIASSHDGDKTQRFQATGFGKSDAITLTCVADFNATNTRSSRRRCENCGDREARIVRTLNHLISRRIVEQAKRTKATIVLEDLEGIRAGLGVSQGQRYERFSWSYFQFAANDTLQGKVGRHPILSFLRLHQPDLFSMQVL